MKIIKDVIKEMVIIVFILQIGVFISSLIKPIIFIPGSIVGMIILFALLITGVLRVKSVNISGKFLLRNMGFFFIPLGVSILGSVDLLRSVWKELVIIIVVSGFLVMLVSAKVTEICINYSKKKREF